MHWINKRVSLNSGSYDIKEGRKDQNKKAIFVLSPQESEQV